MVHEFQQSGCLCAAKRTVTVDSVLANSKTQNAFLFIVNAIFRHDYPLAVEPESTPRPLVQKKTWRDSLPIDMLLSAVSVLVVAQSSSEIPEGLMNIPVYLERYKLRNYELNYKLQITNSLFCIPLPVRESYCTDFSIKLYGNKFTYCRRVNMDRQTLRK